jgi:hypothetical protein
MGAAEDIEALFGWYESRHYTYGWREDRPLYLDLGRSEPERLVAIARELHTVTFMGRRHAHHLVGALLDGLAHLPGVDAARAYLAVLELEDGVSQDHKDRRHRWIDELAQAHPHESLLGLLAEPHTPSGVSALLRWLERLVRRGMPVDVPVVRQFLAANAGHPLADLPLVPLFLLNEDRGGTPLAEVTVDPAARPAGVVEIEAPAGLRALPAYSVHHYLDLIEARVFVLAEARTGLDPALLATMDLACLEGAARLRPHGLPPDRVWSILYDHARRDDDPRRAALAALAGLVGLPLDAPPDHVAEAARHAHFVGFEASSDFFFDTGDGWSLGLACLDASGRRLAVLAASDTYG